MKRTLAIFLLLALAVPAVVSAAQEETIKRRVKAWAAGQEWSLYGGYSVETFDSPVWQDVLGKDTQPMMRFGGGWYALPNFSVDFAIGGMYDKFEAVGTVSGQQSGEEVKLLVLPVEVGVRYRFRFLDNQLLVPSVFAGYDWWYFNENPKFGSVVEGNKTGWHYGADIGFLLDAIDPLAAHRMAQDWNVMDTYLCLGYEVLPMNAGGGLDFSGNLVTLSLRFDVGPERAHAKP